jgi:hypothetical protein
MVREPPVPVGKKKIQVLRLKVKVLYPCKYKYVICLEKSVSYFHFKIHRGAIAEYISL